MRTKEPDRLTVIQKRLSGVLSQLEVSHLIGLSTRQVRRLERQYREYGAPGIVSKKRGNPSNNKLSDDLQHQAVKLIRQNYQGFGPSFAQEKLALCRQVHLSKESLRRLMCKNGLWKSRFIAKANILTLP